MEIGEPCSGIKVFDGVSSECAFVCPSGNFGVFNSETNQIIFSKKHEKPLTCVTTDSNNKVYYADERCVYMQDIRTNNEPEFILQLSSDIISIAASGSTIAASTKDRGIFLNDCRVLEFSPESNHSESAICAPSISFNNLDLLAGYQNSSVSIWETVSGAMTGLMLPSILEMHCLEAISVFYCNQIPVVCYSSGITVYKDSEPNFTTLDKTSLFSCASYSPCFGNDFCILGMNDGNISVLNAQNMTEIASKQYGHDPISKITGNSLMVVASFEGDDGSLSSITPEDFGLF